MRDALARLYDPVSLQSHPLARTLRLPPGPMAGGAPRRRCAGRVLRHRLLDAIARLRPEGKAGEAAAGAWRRHRLLELRYVEALDPPAVQAQLGIEKSQYYREHARALAAVVAALAGDFGTPALRAGRAGAAPDAGPGRAPPLCRTCPASSPASSAGSGRSRTSGACSPRARS